LAVTIDHRAALEFTRELVRIPSVFDLSTGRCEQPAADAVAAQMRAFGWDVTVDQVAPGRPNIIATIDGGRPGPTLCFEGHTDVVTEGDASQWIDDPFGAVVRDGKLYGRGSADMKSGLVAAMWAAHDVARRGPFPGRIIIAALVDEEGMMSGVKQFVANGFADGIDAAICCEPEGGEVCHTSKGAVRLRIDFRGAMAHGAMPFMGRNPNRALGTFLTAIADLQDDLQAEHATDEYLGDVWITPTVLRSGEPVQMNVMPADASAWLDLRTTPGVIHDVLVARVHALAMASGDSLGITATVEVIDDRPAVFTSTSSLLVRSVRDAHCAVLGEPARLGGVPGSTDGTVLTSRTGMPTVVYGPGGKWIAHQVDEFVEIADIERHTEVYVEAALRFLYADGAS
jgi:succinyl-diaminopimelate desuccinylase